MNSNIDTLLDIPLFMKDALNIKDMTVYLNRYNNKEYIVYDTLETMVGPVDVNSWCGPNYDKSVYEDIHGNNVFKSSDTQSVWIERPPSKREPPFKKLKTSQENEKRGLKRKHDDIQSSYEGDKKISKISFVNHFMNNYNHSVRDFLYRIYDVLDGFEINQQTFDVVIEILQSVYTKSLENTMGCIKHNKQFKAQMQYILTEICPA